AALARLPWKVASGSAGQANPRGLVPDNVVMFGAFQPGVADPAIGRPLSFYPQPGRARVWNCRSWDCASAFGHPLPRATHATGSATLRPCRAFLPPDY